MNELGLGEPEYYKETGTLTMEYEHKYNDAERDFYKKICSGNIESKYDYYDTVDLPTVKALKNIERLLLALTDKSVILDDFFDLNVYFGEIKILIDSLKNPIKNIVCNNITNILNREHKPLYLYWGKDEDLIVKVNNIFLSLKNYLSDDYLPKKETAPQLTRALTKREQQFLFDRLAEQQFISDDYESFCFAFGGTTTDNFRKIAWLKNKQSLRTLLRQLKSENLTIAQTMKNVEYFFIDKKGNTLKLPEKDRIHNDNHDEDVMNKIIAGLKQLEK